jgi:dephospho-CoA kinase
MLKVGLTGGIGSGKTLVCSVLEKLGVAVYYADLEARRLMSSDSELVLQISGLFGNKAYKGGCLNREFLAQRVFKDKELLTRLNELVHPAVRKDFSRWASEQKPAFYVVEEAAILFESGSDRNMDLTVGVFAEKELRVQRVMQRDGIAREQVRMRMNSQMNEKEKMEKADIVINNDGKLMILPQIINMHNAILKRR